MLDRLAERLREEDFSLKVIYDPNENDGPGYALRPYCYPTIRVKDSKFLNLFGIECSRMLGLLEAIRAHRPAAVIVDGTPRFLTNLRVPAVTRAGGGVPLLWSKGHTEEGTTDRYLTDLLRSRFAKLYDGVICYGQAGMHDLERIGVPAETITIAQNTIDTDRIFDELGERDTKMREIKRKYGLEGHRIVLYCSTMYPKKRHLDLIEAWPMIHAAHPEAVLVMVGGGPMYEAVRARARELGDKEIRILGRVPEGEDYSWIGAADVSVMCGGLGLAIQQSMAFGRPMVVADEPGVDGEVVRHGETGWRYPRGDLAALANTVNAVLADIEGADAVAVRGQALVRDHVNINGMVNGFMTALEKAHVFTETR